MYSTVPIMPNYMPLLYTASRFNSRKKINSGTLVPELVPGTLVPEWIKITSRIIVVFSVSILLHLNINLYFHTLRLNVTKTQNILFSPLILSHPIYHSCLARKPKATQLVFAYFHHYLLNLHCSFPHIHLSNCSRGYILLFFCQSFP